MANIRAPKQWSLTKVETITSFEAWRQNLQYTLSLDQNFASFLVPDVTWLKKSNNNPLRGLEDDGEDIPERSRRTAQQKLTHLELMLGQIANYCPVVSRNTIVKNSTSVNAIWQAIRLHFGFQTSGAHFLDFDNIKLEPEERPEDLYQRLMSFVEDSLLQENGNILHHGELMDADEELTPTLENIIVLTWLRLLHPGLPNLVKQRYGPELRSRTLASLKPEISQALDSLLEEIHSTSEAKILRSAMSSLKLQNTPANPKHRSRSCPLCKQAKRKYQHFLSKCPYLPDEDKSYFSRLRQVTCMDDDNDIDEMPTMCDTTQQESSPAVAASRRVGTQQSPHFKAFYQHHPLHVTLDTGAETSMIKASLAHYIGANINKSTQQARQADGITPLTVIGEIHIVLSRNNQHLKLDALVVEDLDVDVLAGTPFMIENDISLRPAKKQILIQNTDVVKYDTGPNCTTYHNVCRAKAFVLHAPSTSTVVWPGEYIELDVPEEIRSDNILAIEARSDSSSTRNLVSSHMWPKPHIIESVGNKIRLYNATDRPKSLNRHEHFCQIRLTTPIDTTDNKLEPQQDVSNTQYSTPVKQSGFYSDTVKLDSDNVLSDSTRDKFRQLLQKYDNVFNPDIVGYNGAAGSFEAVVNMGPVQPPQRKGRVPQYDRRKLVELQHKFDELERANVFQRPEDVGVTVEYLNPSFLIRKPSGDYRLVTAFADVGRYSKPQPSLMPDVDSTLRNIARWKYVIVSDLTRAFYQIPLSKASMKYCGVATPFRGVRVYTRSAMGMPGSETALEELMCRVLGDFLQDGFVTKIADDLYCGGDSPEELYTNWSKVLQALDNCNLRLSATKTIICPRSTTILGWIWTEGKLSASSHRIAALSTCPPPDTVKGLRSFIGAYKILGRVIPNYSQVLDPLEAAISGSQSQDKIQWTDSLHQQFLSAQQSLHTNKSIVLPRPSDQLWIATDGSTTKRGLGATLYVTRHDKLMLAGFFSAKLRKHQVAWLPCEIEALGIAAAVKHFCPYIIQSVHTACILTDSQPCVQAFDKLCRGEFSASPRVTSFLSTVSRYQVSVQHLAGSANVPSDFASRTAPDCNEPHCQVCAFINCTADSVVRNISTQDVLANITRLPFTSRAAWAQIQLECPDLRRVHAHLKQGTRPSKKLTNLKDVKRYLNIATIARDGLLIVQNNQPLAPSTDRIIVPRSVIDGLLTALHIKLDHPTKHQLTQVIQRHFYALDMSSAINRVSAACHTCTSLKKLPNMLIKQSSEDPPEVVGLSFAADVIKRFRQLILVLRETTTSFTVSCLIPDEKGQTLRDNIAKLCMNMHPLDGPPAVIRVDPAPGFVSLRNDRLLQQLGISVDIGHPKNTNKNPVAEKAISELVDELLRQNTGGGPVSDLNLAIATARLNSRIRNQGLSAREMWTQRNQYTNVQIPVLDRDIILNQHHQRDVNHAYSEISKHRGHMSLPKDDIHVGDLVYLRSEGDKLQARSRYLVMSIDGDWCFVKKFTGSQLRATSYKVKVSDCYKVPTNPLVSVSHPPCSIDSDEDEAIIEQTPIYQPPVAPQALLRPAVCDYPVSIVSPPDSHQQLHDVIPSDTHNDISDHHDQSVDTQQQPSNDYYEGRPQRNRRPPSYLKDFVT